MTNRIAFLFLAASLVGSTSAQARLGDGVLQTIARYGQPVAVEAKPGALTAIRTFQASGLTITCGYVKGTVEMEGYSRDDRAFLPIEVEALLRTNGRHKNWTPGTGFGPGTYHRTDGATGVVTETQVVLTTPKWTAALAKDKAAADKGADVTSKKDNAAAPVSSTTNAANNSVTKP